MDVLSKKLTALLGPKGWIGPADCLPEAGSFVQTLEHRQGLKLACLEEIAFNQGWLNINDLNKTGSELIKTSYGQYLLSIVAEHS